MAQDRPPQGSSPPAADAHDFTALALEYRPRLIRYFRHHLGTPDDAEDMAQDTLIRAIRSPSITGVANMEAFLLTIAGNLLRDRIRRERASHSRQHVSIDDAAEDLPTEDIHAERVYQDKARLKCFLDALEQLPPRCQQVFLLQRYDGLTYSAIAGQLGISVSAVEKHMMRALLHFASRMESQ
ncbi:MAG: RNA polymerase sigma factor [Thermomonas sp.]|uniref:RNA polymerase sigma factor n=1 Tax=Thermomonas sp. TaxID=1971895 RepID=UPI0039E4717F